MRLRLGPLNIVGRQRRVASCRVVRVPSRAVAMPGIPSAMSDVLNTMRSVTVVDCARADFAWAWPVMSIKHASLTNLAES
jgi:hypothetical protein